jgi:hypothetical protein
VIFVPDSDTNISKLVDHMQPDSTSHKIHFGNTGSDFSSRLYPDLKMLTLNDDDGPAHGYYGNRTGPALIVGDDTKEMSDLIAREREGINSDSDSESDSSVSESSSGSATKSQDEVSDKDGSGSEYTPKTLKHDHKLIVQHMAEGFPELVVRFKFNAEISPKTFRLVQVKQGG